MTTETRTDILAFEAGRRAALEQVAVIAEDCEKWAESNDQLGEHHLNRGDTTSAQRAFGSRDAHTSVARRLREVLG